MKILLYCTKSKPYINDCKLINNNNNKRYSISNKGLWSIDLSTQQTYSVLNGKIVAECDFEVEKIKVYNNYYVIKEAFSFLRKSCLDFTGLDNYLKGKNGYAIHIKNLHIFDEQHRLDDYFILNENPHILEKAPQNMCRVSQRFGGLHTEDTPIQDYILISIRPEWLCKILNGEKTIEVRKKVLKEMLNDK